MPTLPGSRGSSGRTEFVSVSCMRIARATTRKLADVDGSQPDELGRDRLRRGQPGTAHHRANRLEVGRTACACTHQLCDVVEIGGAEHAWAGDRQELRVVGAVVVEPVDLSAPDADRVAWADVVRGAVDRPGADALQS